MTVNAPGETLGHIREDIVLELIAPQVAYTEVGRGGALTDYLYRPLQQSQSTEAMVTFIDDIEKFIYLEDTDDEENHLKLYRLLRILTDMPETIPEPERKRAWNHFLAADWVHMYAKPGQLSGTLSALAVYDPRQATMVKDLMRTVFEDKSAEFEASYGFSEAVPRLDVRNLSLEAFMKGVTEIRFSRAEALPLYNSLATLAVEAA